MRHINNERGFRSDSLCILDAIICWFSWARKCWKIILPVPLSVAPAASCRQWALPESDNHHKVNFVPDSMEVIGGRCLMGMLRIILSSSFLVYKKALSVSDQWASEGISELPFKGNVGDHLKHRLPLKADVSFCWVLARGRGSSLLASPCRAGAAYPAGGAVPAGGGQGGIEDYADSSLGRDILWNHRGWELSYAQQ